jgi:hypothetical protein
LLPQFQIYARWTFFRAGLGKQDYLGRASRLFQQPRNYQAVPTVISLPAQNYNLATGEPGKLIAAEFSDRRARIFHQLPA